MASISIQTPHPHKHLNQPPGEQVPVAQALEHIQNYLNASQTSPHLHPDALFTESGIQYAGSAITGGVVLHQLRRVEAGLKGVWLGIEPEGDDTKLDSLIAADVARKQAGAGTKAKGKQEGAELIDADVVDAPIGNYQEQLRELGEGDIEGEVDNRNNAVQNEDAPSFVQTTSKSKKRSREEFSLDDEDDAAAGAEADTSHLDKAARKKARKERKQAEKQARRQQRQAEQQSQDHQNHPDSDEYPALNGTEVGSSQLEHGQAIAGKQEVTHQEQDSGTPPSSLKLKKPRRIPNGVRFKSPIASFAEPVQSRYSSEEPASKLPLEEKVLASSPSISPSLDGNQDENATNANKRKNKKSKEKGVLSPQVEKQDAEPIVVENSQSPAKTNGNLDFHSLNDGSDANKNNTGKKKKEKKEKKKREETSSQEGEERGVEPGIDEKTSSPIKTNGTIDAPGPGGNSSIDGASFSPQTNKILEEKEGSKAKRKAEKLARKEEKKRQRKIKQGLSQTIEDDEPATVDTVEPPPMQKTNEDFTNHDSPLPATHSFAIKQDGKEIQQGEDSRAAEKSAKKEEKRRRRKAKQDSSQTTENEDSALVNAVKPSPSQESNVDFPTQSDNSALSANQLVALEQDDEGAQEEKDSAAARNSKRKAAYKAKRAEKRRKKADYALEQASQEHDKEDSVTSASSPIPSTPLLSSAKINGDATSSPNFSKELPSIEVVSTPPDQELGATRSDEEADTEARAKRKAEKRARKEEKRARKEEKRRRREEKQRQMETAIET